MLSTYVGGIPEVVRDGVEGWLVPPRNSDALAHALLEAIRQPEERLRRAQNAHQRIAESFTAAQKVAEIERILEQVARK